jgi:hypothetical protein
MVTEKIPASMKVSALQLVVLSAARLVILSAAKDPYSQEMSTGKDGWLRLRYRVSPL